MNFIIYVLAIFLAISTGPMTGVDVGEQTAQFASWQQKMDRLMNRKIVSTLVQFDFGLIDNKQNPLLLVTMEPKTKLLPDQFFTYQLNDVDFLAKPVETIVTLKQILNNTTSVDKVWIAHWKLRLLFPGVQSQSKFTVLYSTDPLWKLNVLPFSLFTKCYAIALHNIDNPHEQIFEPSYLISDIWTEQAHVFQHFESLKKLPKEVNADILIERLLVENNAFIFSYGLQKLNGFGQLDDQQIEKILKVQNSQFKAAIVCTLLNSNSRKTFAHLLNSIKSEKENSKLIPYMIGLQVYLKIGMDYLIDNNKKETINDIERLAFVTQMSELLWQRYLTINFEVAKEFHDDILHSY